MHARNRTWLLGSDPVERCRQRTLPVEGGDGSTLTLDFTTGVLDPRLTFTRGSGTNIVGGVTYTGSDGFLKYAGTNEPRFDYDPTTQTPRGLLLEGQASTLNAYSEDFSNAYWQTVNTTISTTSVTCPDNIGRTTVRVVDDATNASHSIRRGIATTAGTTYTLSFFVRKGSTDTFAAQCFWSASYQFTLTVSSIDNNTQSITSASGVNAAATRVAYSAFGSSPWYRYSITFTHPLAVGAATPDFNFCPINNVSSYVGSGNHTDFFGIQLEAGSRASSYIPTGASTATRVADSCIMEGANFSTWWVSPESWSMLLDFTPIGVVAGQTPDALRLINRSSTNNSTWFYYYGASTMTLVSRIGNGTAVENNAATGQTYGNRAKVMHAIAPGVHTLSFNGSTVAAANTIASMPTGINALGIVNNGLSGALAAGHAAVRSVKFWPTALPQATLNSLTTL